MALSTTNKSRRPEKALVSLNLASVKTRSRTGGESSFSWKSCFWQFCLQDIYMCVLARKCYAKFDNYVCKTSCWLSFSTTDCSNLPVKFAATSFPGLSSFCTMGRARRGPNVKTWLKGSTLLVNSNFLCGLREVYSHIMASSDLFICPRESSACQVIVVS